MSILTADWPEIQADFVLFLEHIPPEWQSQYYRIGAYTLLSGYEVVLFPVIIER